MFLRQIVSWLFPHTCVVCGEPSELLHKKCVAGGRRNGLGRAFEGLARPPVVPHPDIYCTFSYSDPRVRTLVRHLKTKTDRTLTDNLGWCLAQTIADVIAERAMFNEYTNPIIIPIPARKERIKRHGFNQAYELSRACATHMPGRVRVIAHGLMRNRVTAKQAFISHPLERTKNIHGAFSVPRHDLVSGQDIIVIDDLTTTGSTLHEAGRALAHANARHIIYLTLAYQPLIQKPPLSS